MDGLSIVIPALNEAETISQVISEVKRYGNPIVVDDGSTDKTAAISSLAGALVVKHKTNKGYEEALNSGFRKAAELGSTVIMTLDADGHILVQTSSKINNDAHLQLKNYLLSLPKNDSKELKVIKEGILLNWRSNLDPTDEGEAGTEIELYSFNKRRFKLLHSN